MKYQEPMKRLNIEISYTLYESLSEQAETLDLKVSQYIRVGLAKFMAANSEKLAALKELRERRKELLVDLSEGVDELDDLQYE